VMRGVDFLTKHSVAFNTLPPRSPQEFLQSSRGISLSKRER
jgi:hypothetical protein